MNALTDILSDWTDKDWNSFSKWIVSMLKMGGVKVTFTKKDGTERTMNCTLKPEQLPEMPVTENKKVRKVNPDVLAVYDLDANGWRSFVIKSVKRVELTI